MIPSPHSGPATCHEVSPCAMQSLDVKREAGLAYNHHFILNTLEHLQADDLFGFLKSLQRKYIEDQNLPKEYKSEHFSGSVEAFLKSTRDNFGGERPHPEIIF